MKVDDLISQWGAYELKLLESGGGFPSKTILATWGESQGHSGFGSSIPTGLNDRDLNQDIIKVRTAVKELPNEHRLAMLAKHVLRLPIRVIIEELGIGHTTLYNRLKEARNLIENLLAVC